MESPLIASPRPRETRASTSASWKCVVASTIAFARSEGFVEEGVLRDALLTGDRFESLLVMSLLRPEWTP